MKEKDTIRTLDEAFQFSNTVVCCMIVSVPGYGFNFRYEFRR